MQYNLIATTKDLNTADFQEGTLLLVDKPLSWTSFDVVNKIRYALKHLLKVKKIKVGHAGTLDPLATGLLLICTGKFTKLINELQDLDKTYTGTFKLGATTASYDGEMPEEQVFDISGITEEDIHTTASSFLGLITQFPPAYSAVKIDGKASYKRVRSGEEVIMKSREVKINSFTITSVELPFINFEVSCSKGTYIRSLANDFGRKLNNGAYLTKLRRTKTAGYSIEDSWPLDALIDAIKLQENQLL